MVSTLSGLNFSLYRERLRRHNHSFISILTSCCRICPTCSFLHEYSCPQVHWSQDQFCATDCSQLGPEATLTQASQQPWHESLPYPVTRVKVIHTTCCRLNMSAVAWNKLALGFSAWFSTKCLCQQHFQLGSSWEQSTKLHLPSSKYQQH